MQSFKRQIEELKMIEERCNHMIINFPFDSSNIDAAEMQQFNQNYDINEYGSNNSNNVTNLSNVSPVPKWINNYSLSETTVNRTTMSNCTMSNTTTGQMLKSQATKQIPQIKSVDNDEMSIVPK